MKKKNSVKTKQKKTQMTPLRLSQWKKKKIRRMTAAEQPELSDAGDSTSESVPETDTAGYDSETEHLSDVSGVIPPEKEGNSDSEHTGPEEESPQSADLELPVIPSAESENDKIMENQPKTKRKKRGKNPEPAEKTSVASNSPLDPHPDRRLYCGGVLVHTGFVIFTSPGNRSGQHLR